MPAPNQGPLGQYGIARSLVQTPGWKALEAEQNEMLPGGGGRGGSGMSFRMGGGPQPWASEYRGRVGPNTTNLPPSMRGLYGNSAPSAEALTSAYNANLANGMTHAEIMKLFNDQADRDADFWAKGFANDPNFDKTLLAKSQAMVAAPYGTTAASGKKWADKLKEQQKNKSLLQASAGAFTTPTLGPTAGSWSAPKVTNTVWSASPGASNMGTTASTWKPSWTGGF